MKYLSKIATVFALLFLINIAHAKNNVGSIAIDKAVFYGILSGTNPSEIDKIIKEIRISNIVEKTAYEGALLMKKAGLQAKPKDKLKLFKKGKALLEKAIEKNNDNTEFRFLRMIIQENAPKILNYKAALDEDSKMVKAGFAKLDPAVQQVIKEYSKTSKVVAVSDF